MDDAESEVASSNIRNDETEGDEVIDAIDILIIFGKFFMERIDRLDASVGGKLDFFFLKRIFDGATSTFKFFVGLVKASFGKSLEIFVAFWV